MNFKTTIILVVLLAAAGLAVFVTRDKSGGPAETSVESQQKILDVQPGDVTKLTITSADGKKLALERKDTAWRITEPVSAAGETFEIDNLLRSLTGLESTNIVTGATATGLDKPRFTVDVTTKDGKALTLFVGEKTAIGESVYVSRKDKGETLVVSDDLVEHLGKPVSTYRDLKLVDMTASQVSNITIAKPDGKIVLSKSGNDWKIAEPAQMPAEKSDVDDIIFGLTGLRAAEIVAEDTKDAVTYQLEPARFTATLSAAPTTLPTGVAAAATAPATQPAPIVIKLGGYDDVLKRNILATSSQNPVIAKVGAHIIETINKKPLDLRDRKVLDIDSAQVSSISITADQSATTRPTSRPASKSDVTIKRRQQSPATQPVTKPATTTTAPSTTQAATQPATPPLTKWQVGTTDLKDAEDARVDTLLSQLHPLRVTKYLESAPTTQPAGTYIVTVVSQAAGGAPPQTHELRLVDPGDSKPLIGSYNGLAFEADRLLIDRLTGDFLKSSKPAGGFENEAPTEPPGTPFHP